MNEHSTKKKNEELPKRENYEREDEWEADIWHYFEDKVIITKEELEAYESYRAWGRPPEEYGVDFELDGKHYEVVVLRFPDDRPQYDWYTRIFVVKKK